MGPAHAKKIYAWRAAHVRSQGRGFGRRPGMA
jgi:hypothetical protein